MTQVPLTIYKNGERIVIGSCDVETTEKSYVLSGVIEHPEYQGLIQPKFNPDHYSIGFTRDDEVIETTWIGPPPGRARFTGEIPHES